MFFLGVLSIQCKIRRDQPSEVTLADQLVDAIDLLAIPGLF